MQNVVTITGVKKLYKMGSEIVAALNGVDLRIDEGEFVALMGPSGSGKSTLMNILGCLDRPTEGSYKLLEQEVSGLSDDQLAAIRNQTIGFVFQNFNLLPKLSSLENVALPAVYAGLGSSDRMKLALEALEKVSLADRAEHLPSELSGGQRQRVSIARAFVRNPKILILDDSTSAVDTATEKKLRSALEEKIPGMTKIIISQRISSVESCDRVIVLDNGRVNGFDAPAALLENNAIYRDIYETQMKSGGDFDEP